MTVKLNDFDFNNILIHKKLHEYILIYGIRYKTVIGSKKLRIKLDKIDGFIKTYDGTKYLVLLSLKNMTPYMTELDIL